MENSMGTRPQDSQYFHEFEISNEASQTDQSVSEGSETEDYQ